MDTNQKTQVIERLRQAQNVLITVSNDPSVDQLAAAIGFALMMNKLGKHATAVFSGIIPSTLEFLQPEDTLEQNTDSLRDFIISLDKAKADKLRYKVEENVVKIFITPYKTSLSEADLNFSQGDFNVDVVIALGVDQQEHLDQAIMAHGRILHDATVIGVAAGNTTTDIGSINWMDPTASSLCEMLVSISEAFQSNLLDGQMATAFLTGIVANTDRFSNDKTTPKVMTMSAQLMAAGANQQLISTKLTLPPEPPQEAFASEVTTLPSDYIAPVEPQPTNEQVSAQLPPPPESPKDTEGTIALHEENIPPPVELPPASVDKEDGLPEVNEIKIDDQGTLYNAGEIPVNSGPISPRDSTYNRGLNIKPPTSEEQADYTGYMTEPPQMGGTLTANTQPEPLENAVDPLSVIPEAAIPPPPGLDSYDYAPKPAELNSNSADASLYDNGEQSANDLIQSSPSIDSNQPVEKSLADLEASVKANEQSVNAGASDDLDAESARKAVMDAVNAVGYDENRPEPIRALNAQPLETSTEVGNAGQDYAPPTVPPPLVPPFPLPPNNGSADYVSPPANDDVQAPDMPTP